MIDLTNRAQHGIDESGITSQARELREKLVQISLDWANYVGIAPSVTSSIAELDAALLLVRMPENEYCAYQHCHFAVSKDTDFEYQNIRYQVTANRPSGKKGSFVTLVVQKTEKKKPFGWHRLIWILYDASYAMQEAWEFTADQYRASFSHLRRLSPSHMRQGRRLFPISISPTTANTVA